MSGVSSVNLDSRASDRELEDDGAVAIRLDSQLLSLDGGIFGSSLSFSQAARGLESTGF